MLLTSARDEINRSFSEIECIRQPSLRRCESDNFLFSSNLPCLTDKTTFDKWITGSQSRGWTVEKQGKLVYIDVPISCSEQQKWNFNDTGMKEVDCCISILERHKTGCDCDIDVMVRELAKAEEEGISSVERLCRKWHEEWSIMLRENRRLPWRICDYLLTVKNNSWR